ncbi:MAG TPA: acetoacetyl-CoA reductase [Gammaproteobacteria bacterium]|nr:acetoacetyl-CoA reductase [Gammaproteobacteria bacterium]
MASKTALVTGGIGGIGSATCQQLAKDGMQVYALHLPAEAAQAEQWCEQIRQQGLVVNIVAADVSSDASCVTMAADLREQGVSPDVLVNCAGITRDKTLKNLPPELWEAVINTNLSSIYHVTRQFSATMANRGWGRIISISSVNGQRGMFGQTNYCAAKAGIHGFTMALAQELAAKGVTVNSISPGYIDTAMTQAIPEVIRNQITASIPIGRMGKPQDIASTISFLCSEGASYITGANIPVNGGYFMSF